MSQPPGRRISGIEAFAKRDPPAVAVGLTASELEAFVRLLWRNAVAQELTIIARPVETGELVAASTPAPERGRNLGYSLLGQIELA